MAGTLPSCSSPVETASVSLLEIASGSHLFKITKYSLRKGMGSGNYLRSKSFTVGGYKWAIHCYPDGNCEEDKCSYVSAFLTLQSEAKELKVKFNLSLLDQSGKPSPQENHNLSHTFSPAQIDWGLSRFIEQDKLEKSNCLIDDCFTIRCEVYVIKASHTQGTKIAVPPSNLQEHLGRLLESGKGTDVTFIVGGESISAHRIVLAARSPVFDAELFGSMKEGRTQCNIVIDDMEAQVFKALLHFIYTDELPKMENVIEESTKEKTTMIAQHLLVAADRYELERLRLLCEDKLCKCMDVTTLATTLVLAEQHHREQLKAICIAFIADQETRLAVMATDGFKHLKESCPMLAWDLLEKLP